MADQKVSDLPSLNGSAVDPADLLYIVDSSAGTAGSKKITIGQFQLAPYSAGTINGITYFDGSKVLSSGSGLTFDGTNLGVGTASPAQIVDISKAQNAATILAIRNSNAGATASVGLIGNADTAVGRFNVYSSGAAGGLANCVSIEQSTANPILFYVNSSEAIRITGARDVGIGISSVTSGYKLDVNGAVNARASAANTNGLRVEATAGYVSNLSLFRSAYAEWFIGSSNNSASLNISVTDGTHATPSMTFTSARQVGIGTTSPGVILDVQQPTNDATIQVKTTTGAGAWLQTYDSTAFYSGVKHVGNNGAQRWISGMSDGNAAYCIAGSADGSTNRFTTIDTSGNLIQRVNAAAPTLSTNSTMSFELTSNTSLKIVVRGTDGVTRSATLTLS